jgi:hypothetical protein
MVPTNVLHNVQVSSPSNAQLNPQPVLESSTASVPHAANTTSPSPETLLASVPPSLLPILQTAAQNIAQQFYLDSERFPIPAFQIARTGGGILLSPMPSLSLTSNGNSQNDVPHAGNFQTQANANDSTPTLRLDLVCSYTSWNFPYLFNPLW